MYCVVHVTEEICGRRQVANRLLLENVEKSSEIKL